MSDEPQYLTREGADKLRAELDDLLTVKRPELAYKLKEAISMGDLRENADYHDAKEQQGFLEGRIRALEILLRRAVIIDDDAADAHKGVIRVGSEVTIIEDGYEDAETYRIVGAAEANPNKGTISNESPLGASLLGKKAGNKVKVTTPDGVLTFKVKSVK